MLVLNKAKHSRKLWILRHFSWKTKLSFHGWFFSVPEKTMKCATTLLHFPLLQKTQRRTFRCFTNHAREYSPTTESKPRKATSDQNIFVAIIYYAKRKPDKLAPEKILSLLTEVVLCNLGLDTTFPGFRWRHPDLVSVWVEKYLGY